MPEKQLQETPDEEHLLPAVKKSSAAQAGVGDSHIVTMKPHAPQRAEDPQLLGLWAVHSPVLALPSPLSSPLEVN